MARERRTTAEQLDGRQGWQETERAREPPQSGCPLEPRQVLEPGQELLT